MPLTPKECRRTTGITKSGPGLSHLVVLRFFHCLLLADSQHLTSHADHVVATNDRHISSSRSGMLMVSLDQHLFHRSHFSL